MGTGRVPGLWRLCLRPGAPPWWISRRASGWRGGGWTGGGVAAWLEAGVALVVDLSADFRLPEVGMYEEWYGGHPAPGLLAEAHYGLPEVFGAAEGRLVANPGCYPTAAVLALAPVVRRVGGEIGSIVVNALSGVSGAGARPSVKPHFGGVDGRGCGRGAP